MWYVEGVMLKVKNCRLVIPVVLLIHHELLHRLLPVRFRFPFSTYFLPLFVYCAGDDEK